MYRGAGETWRGFSKNLYEGLGARLAPLALVLALYALAFLVPWRRCSRAPPGATPRSARSARSASPRRSRCA